MCAQPSTSHELTNSTSNNIVNLDLSLDESTANAIVQEWHDIGQTPEITSEIIEFVTQQQQQQEQQKQ